MGQLLIELGRSEEAAGALLAKAFEHTGCSSSSAITDLVVIESAELGRIGVTATIAGEYDEFSSYTLTLSQREFLDVDRNLVEGICGYGSQDTGHRYNVALQIEGSEDESESEEDSSEMDPWRTLRGKMNVALQYKSDTSFIASGIFKGSGGLSLVGGTSLTFQSLTMEAKCGRFMTGLMQYSERCNPVPAYTSTSAQMVLPLFAEPIETKVAGVNFNAQGHFTATVRGSIARYGSAMMLQTDIAQAHPPYAPKPYVGLPLHCS